MVTIVRVLAKVDRIISWMNDANLAPQREVNGRRAELIVHEGVDSQATRLELGKNGFSRQHRHSAADVTLT